MGNRMSEWLVKLSDTDDLILAVLWTDRYGKEVRTEIRLETDLLGDNQGERFLLLNGETIATVKAKEE